MGGGVIGQPRAPGRHRAGRPHTLVHRRVWDSPARDQAERLNQAFPGWVVLYGPGSRRFYAIATWPAPEPIMVEATTTEDLAERMREAETALLLHAGAFSGQARRHPPLPADHRRAVRTFRGLPYPPEGSAA